MTENGTMQIPPGFNAIKKAHGDLDLWCCPVRTADAIIEKHEVEVDSYTLLRLLDNCKRCRYAAYETNEEE